MMKNVEHIYFIGIGGISMSGLAELMLFNKIKVSGSDWKESKIIKKLKLHGANIYIGENENNITEDIDLLVYTSAVRENHPELIKAKELGVKILGRSDFLGGIMLSYKNSVCVSGTHGKTTTTGMLSQILINSTLEPTIFLGGELGAIDGNIKIGKNNLLLTEACEYKRNFLKFNPTVEIILNIEADHLDYYKDIHDIEDAFVEYVDIMNEKGLLVVNNINKDLFNNKRCKVITFGLDEKSDIYAKDIEYYPTPQFNVVYSNREIGKVELGVVGEHNILNSLSAIATCIHLEIDFSVVQKGLKDFKGTKRRYEYIGQKKGINIFDDYAHHPTEIMTTLNTAKKYTKGNITTIFQPHTYTRTKELLDEFSKSFNQSDNLIIVDIYAAREVDNGEIHSKDLVNKIKSYNENVEYAESFELAATKALKKSSSGDTIITMGAGNVCDILDLLL